MGGGGGRDGGTVLNKVLHGQAPLRALNPYTPFVWRCIDKWYPSHLQSLELSIPFNCCKCTLPFHIPQLMIFRLPFHIPEVCEKPVPLFKKVKTITRN